MLDSSRKWIAMTGVTGFIGGSLAAALLRRGHGIVALTRNDDDGSRTKAVIEKALAAEGQAKSVDYAKLLRVVPFDIEVMSTADRNLVLTCDEIWHSAAEMSFSSRKLESSYKMNVGATNALYELMQKGRCKRFYYISTAYTGGAKAGVMEETLHTHPHLVNPYQVTKWSAEMSLASRATVNTQLPVTLFRPAIVIGDTRTGYYPGQPFGLYTFFSAIETTKALGAKSLILDVDPDGKTQFVPIQDLVANAVALSELGHAEREALEIFHATGVAVENLWTLKSIINDTGIPIKFGNPTATLDHLADFFSKFLRKFSNNAIQFDDKKLRARLGDRYTSTKLTEESIRTLFKWYQNDFAEKRKADLSKRLGTTLAGRVNPMIKSSQEFLRVFDAFGTKDFKSKIAKKILQFSI